MATVLIPSQFRGLCGGTSTLDLAGETLGELIEAIDARCPGFAARVVEDGRIRPELAVAIDGEVMSFPLYEPVGPNAEVTIVPAVSGG